MGKRFLSSGKFMPAGLGEFRDIGMRHRSRRYLANHAQLLYVLVAFLQEDGLHVELTTASLHYHGRAVRYASPVVRVLYFEECSVLVKDKEVRKGTEVSAASNRVRHNSPHTVPQ